MPIDEKRYSALATKGEVASVAIRSTVALRAIQIALFDIKRGEPVTDELMKEIDKSIDELGERFNDLAGWTDE